MEKIYDLAVLAMEFYSLAFRTAAKDLCRTDRGLLLHTRACEVFEFVDAWDHPTPLILIPTTYHAVTAKELLRTGKVRMVIYANQGMRAAVRAMKTLCENILDDGTTHHVEGSLATLAEVLEIQAGFQKSQKRRNGKRSRLRLERT